MDGDTMGLELVFDGTVDCSENKPEEINSDEGIDWRGYCVKVLMKLTAKQAEDYLGAIASGYGLGERRSAARITTSAPFALAVSLGEKTEARKIALRLHHTTRHRRRRRYCPTDMEHGSLSVLVDDYGGNFSKYQPGISEEFNYTTEGITVPVWKAIALVTKWQRVIETMSKGIGAKRTAEPWKTFITKVTTNEVRRVKE